MVRPIARLLHRVLWPRPEAAPTSVGQARGELWKLCDCHAALLPRPMPDDLGVSINRNRAGAHAEPVSGPITVKKKKQSDVLVTLERTLTGRCV
jgi:hypothetical protein